MLALLRRLFGKPVGNYNPVIMVIAESKITQESIRRDFESLNCKIISTFYGQSAWQALEEGAHPDVVILDFVLPDDDGPSFFRRLRTDKRFSSIPVVPLPCDLSDEHGTGIHSVKNLLTSQKMGSQVMAFGNSPIVPTEFNSTPFALLFSVAHALRKSRAGLPTAFREKLRSLSRLLTDGINPADPE